ncbi:carbon-nitrogen hydrolase family protein [Phyllobacterium sp. TAF24]|uniref:carbon-nitrogen hydrolase family protein n=1 Tax=Phyllobacterium sp. TAF24 TaxID=3233068 RepID=UPI003F9C25D9
MRIAAFQRTAIFDDPEATSKIVLADLRWAENEGIDLAVFPESFLQGHSYSEELTQYRALSIDDPIIENIVQRSTGKTKAVLGYFERRQEGVFNSAFVFGEGRLLGNYAKSHPRENGCLPGTAFPVWKSGCWKFGVNICKDLDYPDAAKMLVHQGAQIICCPMNMMLRPHKAPLWREPALKQFQTTARNTGTWVIASDVVGTNADGWLSFGCTMIANPCGEIVARARELMDDVVVFDLPETP